MERFAFRGHLDPRCEWEKHERTAESNSARAERLLAGLRRCLAEGTCPADTPIKEVPAGARNRPSKGSRLNIDIRDPEAIALIEEKHAEWNYKSRAHTFRRLMIQACRLPVEEELTPAEAIAKFPVGELIPAKQWVKLFNSNAAHYAAQLAQEHAVKLVFGDKEPFYIPRGFKGAQNAVEALIRMPPYLQPGESDSRKRFYFTAGQKTLPAFSVSELIPTFFKFKDQLQTVVSRDGAIIVQYQEAPIAVLSSQSIFIDCSRSPDRDRLEVLSLTGMSLSDTSDIFFKAIVPSLISKEKTGFKLEVDSLPAIVLVRLDLFDFKAFSDP